MRQSSLLDSELGQVLLKVLESKSKYFANVLESKYKYISCFGKVLESKYKYITMNADLKLFCERIQGNLKS